MADSIKGLDRSDATDRVRHQFKNNKLRVVVRRDDFQTRRRQLQRESVMVHIEIQPEPMLIFVATKLVQIDDAVFFIIGFAGRFRVVAQGHQIFPFSKRLHAANDVAIM